MNYLSVIIKILIKQKRRQENSSQRERKKHIERCSVLKIDDEIISQGIQKSLGTRKGKETDPPLECPEGVQLRQHLDSSPPRLILDFRPLEL